MNISRKEFIATLKVRTSLLLNSLQKRGKIMGEGRGKTFVIESVNLTYTTSSAPSSRNNFLHVSGFGSSSIRRAS